MPSCHSTNDICADLITKGDCEDGMAVVTEFQTNGRGQGSNTWISKPGENLLCSIILETAFLPASKQLYLNMAVSLAVREVLYGYIKQPISVKWPNDLLYENRKVCGLLIQNVLRGSKMEYSIIGVGLNANQDDFPVEQAISLRQITGKWYNLSMIFERLCEILEKYFLHLKQSNNEYLQDQYVKHLYWYQEEHIFSLPDHVEFTGTIVGIDGQGRLKIDTGGSVATYSNREVVFIR